MKRLLVITYYWPPSGGAGVQRWVKFTRYLREFGWEPVIYTPSNPDCWQIDASLAEDIPEGIEVVSTRIREPYAAYRRLFGGASTQITELSASSSSGKSLKSRLALFIRGNFFVPDPRAGWVRPSLRFLKKYLAAHPVDAVVTTGPPQSMHLIGLGLKRKLGLPWVADFRDPWTRMFYFKDLHLLPPVRRRHLRLEAEVLSASDAVIAVSSQVQEDFIERGASRVELITNGYDSSDFEGPLPEADSAHWKVVQTGNIGSDGNPRALWKALSKMLNSDPRIKTALQIRLPGRIDPSVVASLREEGLEEYAVMPGYLSHEKTVLEQRSADLLVLPLREGPEGGKIVPGKTFEYLAARRPVLGIGDPEGAAARILSQTRAGDMFDWNDGSGMLSFLEKSWNGFCEGRRQPLDTQVESYSRRALTSKLASLLDSITRK